MPGKIKINTSFWYDINYHILSYLSAGRADAGSIYSPRYTRYMDGLVPAVFRPGRNITADTELLGRLYDANEKSFLIYSFPLLFRDWTDFLSFIETPFDRITWPAPGQKKLAAILQNTLSLELLELFRIAIWKEAEYGYREISEQQIRPLYKVQVDQVCRQLEVFSQGIRGLETAGFMLSHPLRQYGRLLWPDNRPLIITGIPDPDLEVPGWAPAIQACHEYILSRVITHTDPHVNRTTRPGTPGYAHHMGPEITALSLAASLFKTLDQPGFCLWLKQWFPADTGELTASLPWQVLPGPRQPGMEALASWLASGAAVPPAMQGLYTQLSDWFINSEK